MTSTESKVSSSNGRLSATACCEGDECPNQGESENGSERVPKVEVKKFLHGNCKALYGLDQVPDTLA